MAALVAKRSRAPLFADSVIGEEHTESTSQNHSSAFGSDQTERAIRTTSCLLSFAGGCAQEPREFPEASTSSSLSLTFPGRSTGILCVRLLSARLSLIRAYLRTIPDGGGCVQAGRPGCGPSIATMISGGSR